MFHFSNERDPPSLSDQPVVQPVAWRAVQTTAGKLHLTLVMPGGSFRTTSEIASVDLEGKSLFTYSGRCYMLNLPPASDPMLAAALATNAVRVGLGHAADVSDHLWMGLSGLVGLSTARPHGHGEPPS